MNQVNSNRIRRLNNQSLNVLDAICRRHHDWIKQRAWLASERLARALRSGKEMCDIAKILRCLRFLQELLGELIATEQLCDRLKRGRNEDIARNHTANCVPRSNR